MYAPRLLNAMYDARPNHTENSAADAAPERRTSSNTNATVDTALHVSAAGSPGELTVLERLEAFRGLIRHGNALLGEVVAYCREAEAAVNQIAAEKQDIDHLRGDLQEARLRADTEANAARATMAQAEAQRREVSQMRDELLKAHAEIEQFQRIQSTNAETLEQSLIDARQQQIRLEEELQRVRTQATSSRTLESRLGQLDQMEAKLRVTERELADTRHALEDERGRRDRAIALIKPRQIAGEARA
jgi:DNA repair exonuclease SbcCD ATPase subunit